MNILNQIASCKLPIDLHGDRINSITGVPALCVEIGSVIKLASSSCREGFPLLTQLCSPDGPELHTAPRLQERWGGEQGSTCAASLDRGQLGWGRTGHGLER